MANRVKEDEKNERIIRSLLKLPANRRCINCNSLGPQYVCTNFSTFICTTCSGIHREFTHRVKSVSMAKFSPLEVSALQGGGNASAREIYLKGWDPQRNSLPDGRNIDRLRDFIKHVYVDKRFTGERIMEKPPRDKMGESPDLSGNKSGSRSPSYGPSTGGSPESQQSSNYQRNSGLTEVVNDWRREDRFGNGRGSGNRSSDEEPKVDVRSPDRLTDPDFPSSPEVRPVRDILGDNVVPLRVIDPSNAAGVKSTDGSVRTQRNASPSSLASSDGNPSESKVEAPFIDFGSAPVPAVNIAASRPQIQQLAANESSVHLTASGSNDWANFSSVAAVKVQTASSTSLESLLSGSPIPSSKSAPSGLADTLPNVSSYGGVTAPSVLPPAIASPSVGSLPQFTNVQPSYITNSATRPPNSVFPGDNGQSIPQAFTPAAGLYSTNKALNPLAQTSQEAPGRVFPVASNEANISIGNTSGSAQGSSLESKSSGRKALPEDLFSVNYAYSQPPVPGWYPVHGAPYFAGLPLHYNTPVVPLPVLNYSATARSINPFDVGHEPSHAQPSMFPSVASLQGALPKTATPQGPPQAPNHGPILQNTMPFINRGPVYTSSIPQSAFIGQDTIAARPQAPSSFSSESLNPNLQHLAHSSSSSFTSGGNPFG